jgi:hypothetical protein
MYILLVAMPSLIFRNFSHTYTVYVKYLHHLEAKKFDPQRAIALANDKKSALTNDLVAVTFRENGTL